MTRTFSVITDTATIVIFDLEAIRHRIADAPDWWSISQDEMLETNLGNIAFLGIGQDGEYLIKIVQDVEKADGSLYLNFPSGQVFIGAGEDTTGGGLEPDGTPSIQGQILQFSPGSHCVKFKRNGTTLELSLTASQGGCNSICEPFKL
ncbi:DUF6386 family protein [Pseudomonas sp. KNUC1026]|uniref:DUF6386 family protein n=1 Tax=Pseudomonas sp. KNUC1026 TaxID=2893890 RepID=UPI001F2980F6|nr:DUF6386 family protein [Pseudomonas sp. KNUC1026]UFH49884.1 DUF6386 family protein [Pseudomonas sp. KNUC1026]